MKRTKKAFEAHLNELYADAYSQQQALDNFIYLANNSRHKSTTSERINEAYANRTLGSLLRAYDPIAFNVAFNDWK